MYFYISGVLCQKQVSRTGTDNYTPQYIAILHIPWQVQCIYKTTKNTPCITLIEYLSWIWKMTVRIERSDYVFLRNISYLQSWAKHHRGRIIRCQHRLWPRRQHRSKPHCFHRPAALRQCDAGVVRRPCGCRWLHTGVHLVLCPVALRLPHGGGWAKLPPGRGARWHQDHLERVCGLWSPWRSYH